MNFSKQHYDKLKPLEHYWATFKKSGTVLSIQPNEVDTLDQVHTEVIGTKLNKSCNNCVADALITLFIQFNKFKSTLENEDLKICERVETSRKERPRIQNQRGS